MNESEINRLTEDTLNSITSLKRSYPDELLFQRIMSGLNESKSSYLKENNTGKYLIAFAILILINIFSFISHKSSEENKTVNTLQYNAAGVNDFAKEFFSESDEYSYYK